MCEVAGGLEIQLVRLGAPGMTNLDARLVLAPSACLQGRQWLTRKVRQLCVHARICGCRRKKGYYGEFLGVLTVISLFFLPHDPCTYTHAAMTARPAIYSLRSSRRLAPTGRGPRPYMDALTNPDHDGSNVVTTVFLSNLHCSRYAPFAFVFAALTDARTVIFVVVSSPSRTLWHRCLQLPPLWKYPL